MSSLQPLHGPPPASTAVPRFAGTSQPLLDTLQELDCYARCDRGVVLLEGESGTGKTFFARYLHVRSRRATGPFETVDLAAMEDSLAQSDLFGHTEGAFTGASHKRQGRLLTANGGTVFLDELGKASLAVQRKLLRVIEDREIFHAGSDRPVRLDVRIVAATNVPLEQLVAEQEEEKFLPDLVPRVSMFRVPIPAVRERREDIPAIVRQLVEQEAPLFAYGNGAPAVDAELMAFLQDCDWPDNVRGIHGVVQVLLAHAAGGEILRLEHLGSAVARLVCRRGKGPPTMEEIYRVLAACNNNRTKAAALLDMSRQSLYRYLARAEGDEGSSCAG